MNPSAPRNPLLGQLTWNLCGEGFWSSKGVITQKWSEFLYISEYHTQLARMSFDKIFKLTAGWSVFFIFVIFFFATLFLLRVPRGHRILLVSPGETLCFLDIGFVG